MLTSDKAYIAIKRLNALYGKGDVSNFKLFGDGRITFSQTPYGCKPEQRRGRLNGNTVYALRHRQKI